MLKFLTFAAVPAAQGSLLSIFKAEAAKKQKDPTLGNPPCADPPIGMPAYCCSGIAPVGEYINSCECNPQWTADECSCQGVRLMYPCHECMTHLPATNKWTKAFTTDELYANCEDCVERCVGELKEGNCGTYVDKVLSAHYPSNEPKEIICTSGFLKDQLMKDSYPLNVKRRLYKAPKLTADDSFHQPSDWKVAGIS